MSEQPENIHRELQALSAMMLHSIKQRPVENAPEGLEEKISNAAWKQIQAEKKDTVSAINLKASIKREKAGNHKELLRIAAGIVAMAVLMTMGYKLLFPVAQEDCAGDDLLACMVEQTSGEEIYAYLYELGLPEEDFLYELLNEPADDNMPAEQEYYEIDLP
jgi:hypothetical protein